MSLLRFGYLAYLSQPKADRTLYQLVRKRPCRSVIEMGIGTGVRTRRLLELILRYHAGTKIRYTGIDLFESRPPDAAGLSLKQTYRLLATPNVKVQLLPGDPFLALSRSANSLTDTDLVIISADQNSEALDRAWFYLPRMLHERSLVYREHAGDARGPTTFRLMQRDEIDRLARTNYRPLRRAA